MSDFKAPFLPKKTIFEKVEEFRSKYKHAQNVPVDILDLVEVDLNLDIIPIPGLRNFGEIEALLSGDLSGILIDERNFSDERYQNRLIFSVAHEIAHFVLHSDFYKKYKYDNIDEWINIISSIPDKEYSWIEYQANEFAGQLLVEKQRLSDEFKECQEMLKEANNNLKTNDPITIEYMATHISKKFGCICSSHTAPIEQGRNNLNL